MTDLTLKDLLIILRHGSRMMLILFPAIFFISLFAALLFAPEYEVSTTILIEQDDPSALMLPNPATLLLGGFQTSENETELIKSRAVIDGLVDHFNLQFPVERLNDSFFSQLIGRLRGDPEFIGAPYFVQTHPALADGSGDVTVTGTGYTIGNGSESADCTWGKPCTFKGGQVVMEKAGEIPDGERYEFSYRTYVKARKAVRDSYEAFPLGDKASTLFRVSMETTNTPFAALFLNELVSIFSEKKMRWRTETTEITRAFLERLSSRLKEERDEKLRKLTAFMSNSRTILPDEQVKTLVLRKLELEQQKKEIDIRRSLIGEFRKAIGEEGGARMLPAPMLDDDKAFGDVVSTYNALVMQEKKASEIYLDSHPDLVMLRQQITTARKTIGSMADDSDTNIRQVETLLNTKMTEIDNEMRRLPPELSELAVLKAESQAVEKIFWFLNEKLYENEIKKESMKHDIRIIDPADPREEKLFPRISISLVLAFVLALLLSTAVVFGHYFLRRTLAFGEEIPRLTGHAPLRADLPRIDGSDTELFDDRLLRLLVSAGIIDRHCGIIAVCGIKRGAGISFVAERTAELLARRGYRTVLMGATASAPSPEKTSVPLRVAMESGAFADAAGAVRGKLLHLREDNDFVIVDTPPMSESVDAELLAGEADAVLVVTRVGWTERALLRKHLDILARRVELKEGMLLVAANDSRCIIP
ncbi:MAG TPA: hypothetical protein P5077_04785 [bacterium]|nr:hypothetical protein [bacterium]